MNNAQSSQYGLDLLKKPFCWQLNIILGELDMKKLDIKTKLSVVLMMGAAVGCSALCSPTLYADDTKKQQTKKVGNVEHTAKLLQDLSQREIDASFLLGQAIENVTNLTIRDSLIKAREDCEKNIQALSELIHQHGKEAPTHTKDFKGYFMQGYLAMRGWTSDQGLMRALHSNLQMLIGAYEDALKKELPEGVREKVSQIHESAKDHLRYVASQM